MVGLFGKYILKIYFYVQLSMRMLFNYTHRPISWVYTDNLREGRNERYFIDEATKLCISQTLKNQPPLLVQYETSIVSYCHGVPVVEEKVLAVDPLPEGDDIMIVSKQYAAACCKLCWPTDRLRIVSGPVYANGVTFPVASVSLSKVESYLSLAPDLDS